MKYYKTLMQEGKDLAFKCIYCYGIQYKWKSVKFNIDYP